ncbi:unnamed protein product [Gongylonema pulchrum]|uniref:SPRY domain-containing protein n=1 Tax=Gongylonema pulchrum TaxID=637853 RepID=A0A183EE21_9BILA|nr:unnamed protein product [Gongylonema pulchrum]
MASALQAVFARLGNHPSLSPVVVAPDTPATAAAEPCQISVSGEDHAVLKPEPALGETLAAPVNQEPLITAANDNLPPVSCSSESGPPQVVHQKDSEDEEMPQDSVQEDLVDMQETPGFNNNDNSTRNSISQERNTPDSPMQISVDPSDATAPQCAQQDIDLEPTTQSPVEMIECFTEEQVIASVVEKVIDGTVASEQDECNVEQGRCDEELTRVEIGDDEEMERKPDISEELLRDPRLLLQKASDVLKSLQTQELAAAAERTMAEKQNQQQYEQLPLDKEYEENEEHKPLPDFHGEPVPDSDDEIIIEGVSRKKSTKKNSIQEEEPVPGDEQIEIDFYNADLNIKASETCQEVIDPDNGDGFALMWGGARSTYGIRISNDEVFAHFPPVIFQIKACSFFFCNNLLLQLGEAPQSYAYGSFAKKATNNFFTDYGEPFNVGDVITSCLDLVSSRIFFWKNMQFLGTAFSDVHFDEGDLVFPHVCTKNCKLSVNYGDSASDDWISPSDLQKDSTVDTDFSPIYFSKLDRKLLARGLVPPSSKSECTVS